MRGQDVLDFESRDIFRVANDGILDTAGDTNIAILIQQPEISRAQPAAPVERVDVKCGVGVAEEALGSLKPQFAFTARGQFVLRVVDHADTDPRHRRTDGVVEHFGCSREGR